MTNNLDLGAGDFNVAVSCDDGYYGSAQATACSTAGPFVLSGCSPIVCVSPADSTGYVVTESQLGLPLGFSVSAMCADHYGNAPTDASVTACSEHGLPYTLAGCPLNDACQADQDDCQGDNHICISTGPGEHSCTCPVSSYGTATGDSTAELPAGCTACVPQAGCSVSGAMCSSVLPTKLVCNIAEAGSALDADGTVSSCAIGTYADAGVCRQCTDQVGCQPFLTDAPPSPACIDDASFADGAFQSCDA